MFATNLLPPADADEAARADLHDEVAAGADDGRAAEGVVGDERAGRCPGPRALGEPAAVRRNGRSWPRRVGGRRNGDDAGRLRHRNAADDDASRGVAATSADLIRYRRLEREAPFDAVRRR